MSSPGSSNAPLTDLIRNALVEVYNNSPAGWHEFECAALGALAKMSTEIAKAMAAAEKKEEEDAEMSDAEMPDADDEDDSEDSDDSDEDSEESGNGDAKDDSGGAGGQRGGGRGRGGRDGGGDRIYHCPFAGCGKSYKASRTRTRHIKDKHPN
ncbi:hypothetical protein LY76DRAFT_668478 [Colletotrichum caudatum]|nr:hypothetical protein LY76DRAFT_668478 [Colletotrichum caudatum]